VSLRGFRSLFAVMSAGFDAVGVVMGAIGMQLVRPTGCRGFGFKTEMEPLVFPDYEQALRESWRLVAERLESEAAAVGAHGVVGVGVRQASSAGLSSDNPAVRASQQVLQLQLVGTAVRVRGEAPLPTPFLSTLSMDETFKLLLRGWAPAGIAVGISAVHVHGWAASPLIRGTLLKNAEMAVPTAGMALARTRAEVDVRHSIADAKAQGVVGAEVRLDHSGQSCGGGQGMLIEGFVMGTGVVRYREPVVAVSAVRNLSATGAP
jgi:uncharacterized protein YbjQ (UPF0145 family)